MPSEETPHNPNQDAQAQTPDRPGLRHRVVEKARRISEAWFGRARRESQGATPRDAIEDIANQSETGNRAGEHTEETQPSQEVTLPPEKGLTPLCYINDEEGVAALDPLIVRKEDVYIPGDGPQEIAKLPSDEELKFGRIAVDAKLSYIRSIVLRRASISGGEYPTGQAVKDLNDMRIYGGIDVRPKQYTKGLGANLHYVQEEGQYTVEMNITNVPPDRVTRPSDVYLAKFYIDAKPDLSKVSLGYHTYIFAENEHGVLKHLSSEPMLKSHFGENIQAGMEEEGYTNPVLVTVLPDRLDQNKTRQRQAEQQAAPEQTEPGADTKQSSEPR